MGKHHLLILAFTCQHGDKDKHCLLTDKGEPPGRSEGTFQLFSLLTRLDESHLHRACLIGQGTHFRAALAEGTMSRLAHAARSYPSFQGGAELFLLQCPSSPPPPGDLHQMAVGICFKQVAPWFISQHKLFGFLVMLQRDVQFTYCS